MDEREIKMSGEEKKGGEHEAVVQDNSACEAVPSVVLAHPKQQTGDDKENGKRRGERGIDLLARVESPLWYILRPRSQRKSSVSKPSSSRNVRRKPRGSMTATTRTSEHIQPMPAQKWISRTSGRLWTRRERLGDRGRRPVARRTRKPAALTQWSSRSARLNRLTRRVLPTREAFTAAGSGVTSGEALEGWSGRPTRPGRTRAAPSNRAAHATRS